VDQEAICMKPHPDNVALAPLVRDRPHFKPVRGLVPVTDPDSHEVGDRIAFNRIEGDQMVFYWDAEVILTVGQTGVTRAVDLNTCRMVNWRPVTQKDQTDVKTG
jgi:hypothetical protein